MMFFLILQNRLYLKRDPAAIYNIISHSFCLYILFFPFKVDKIITLVSPLHFYEVTLSFPSDRSNPFFPLSKNTQINYKSIRNQMVDDKVGQSLPLGGRHIACSSRAYHKYYKTKIKLLIIFHYYLIIIIFSNVFVSFFHYHIITISYHIISYHNISYH